MKTKIIIKILVFSCLNMVLPGVGMSQGWLMRVHIVENLAEKPAMSCFSDSHAGFHLRNDFGLKEMMYADVSGVWCVKRNALLFAVNHYGYANYGELQLSAGYGRNFGDRFAMTARIFYLMAHARDYPSRHSLCADFALACKVSGKLWLDANVYNPFMLRYGIVGKDVIPLRFSVGCTYLPVRKLLISLSIAKSLPGAWEVDGRFLIQPINPLWLAVYCSNSRLALLIGVTYKNFLFSVQAAWHYRVSVSPQIGGHYYPNGPNETAG